MLVTDLEEKSHVPLSTRCVGNIEMLVDIYLNGLQQRSQNYDLDEIKVGAKENEKCYDLSSKFKSMQDLMVSDWRNIKFADFPNIDENSGQG